MTCPDCAHDFEPTLIIKGVTVCANCGVSLRVEPPAKATGADLKDFTTADRTALIQLRARPQRIR